MYNWDGSCFLVPLASKLSFAVCDLSLSYNYFRTEVSVSPIIEVHLPQYPFNPASRERGYTNEEKFGEEEFKYMMAERIRQKRRHNLKLFPTEEAFVQTYPGLVGEV